MDSTKDVRNRTAGNSCRDLHRRTGAHIMYIRAWLRVLVVTFGFVA
jgi:hypothetical protein